MGGPLPLFLSDVFTRVQVSPLSGGASGAQVWVLDTEQGEFILKAHRSGDPFHSLRQEMSNCQWLQGKIAVPTVKAFAEEAGVEYLCLSRLPGKPLLDFAGLWPGELWVTQFAETLQRLHAVPLDAAVPSRSLDEYLAAAKQNMEAGLVDIDDLQEENHGQPLAALYQRLLSLRPRVDIDPVFIHGDYSPGNILFNGDGLTGVIDLGRGGAGDRHHDIALALRFIRDDLDPSLCDLFLRVYGWAAIDPSRIVFYELLDEFF